jgi:hypothetical protein
LKPALAPVLIERRHAGMVQRRAGCGRSPIVPPGWLKSAWLAQRPSGGKPMNRAFAIQVIDRWRAMLKMVSHDGQIRVGAINHQAVAISDQTIRHREIAAVFRPMPELAHGHFPNPRMRHRLDA